MAATNSNKNASKPIDFSLKPAPSVSKRLKLVLRFKAQIEAMEKSIVKVVPSYLASRQGETVTVQAFSYDGEKEKCAIFRMSDRTLQAYFKDASVLVFDQDKCTLTFLSPKAIPFVKERFSLSADAQTLATESPSAFKRLLIAKEGMTKLIEVDD